MNFLLQMLRAVRTNYVNNCSYYCHRQRRGTGQQHRHRRGHGQAGDLDHTDLYILVGEPALDHPRLMLRC
jgi:anaerobic selenocysteine-containing dehydrogenase